MVRPGDLPPPPAGKWGWPWTVADEQAALPDRALPAITLVTPSFNQGEYLEETIRSVLLQGYPALEYIVIDGGSRDDSRRILEKYDPWLSRWVSEPDRGQSHAINKGFALGSGEVMNWLCSDDLLAPGGLLAVGERFAAGDADIVTSPWRQMTVRSGKIAFTPEWRPGAERLADLLWNGRTLYQPGTFWRRGLWQAAGGVDESLHYAMDYDLWCRLSRGDVRLARLDRAVAWERIHPARKTCDGMVFQPEVAQVRLREAALRGWSALPFALAALLRRRGEALGRALRPARAGEEGYPGAWREACRACCGADEFERALWRALRER